MILVASPANVSHLLSRNVVRLLPTFHPSLCTPPPPPPPPLPPKERLSEDVVHSLSWRRAKSIAHKLIKVFRRQCFVLGILITAVTYFVSPFPLWSRIVLPEMPCCERTRVPVWHLTHAVFCSVVFVLEAIRFLGGKNLLA